MSQDYSKQVKDICIAAMKKENEKTGKAPVYSKLAVELVPEHTWRHEPALLRQQMRNWWETLSGIGKARKAANVK